VYKEECNDMLEMQETIATGPETIKILITDRIAQEGIDLLRTHLPHVQIDERPGLKPDQFIEVHPHPDQALKDGAQSLTLQQFERLMPQAQAVGAAVGRDFILSEMDAHLPSSACLDASLHRLGGQQSYETALTDPARRTER
jgi:hypothetical protein